jgi:hypothetical protein
VDWANTGWLPADSTATTTDSNATERNSRLALRSDLPVIVHLLIRTMLRPFLAAEFSL